jgi:hypothetical protein
MHVHRLTAESMQGGLVDRRWKYKTMNGNGMDE